MRGGARPHPDVRGAGRDAGDGTAAVDGVVRPQPAGAQGGEEDRGAGHPGTVLAALQGHGQAVGARAHVPHGGLGRRALQEVVPDDVPRPSDRGALPGVVPHPDPLAPGVVVGRAEEAGRAGGEGREVRLDPQHPVTGGGRVGGARRGGGEDAGAEGDGEDGRHGGAGGTPGGAEVHGGGLSVAGGRRVRRPPGAVRGRIRDQAKWP
ncbi:hypothetical protein GCM10010363_01950 [Streptomyces omiyaensis]|nr:hypothetical protein GCM10010363_01950 [Streptomyces omiyaensis]